MVVELYRSSYLLEHLQCCINGITSDKHVHFWIPLVCPRIQCGILLGNEFHTVASYCNVCFWFPVHLWRFYGTDASNWCIRESFWIRRPQARNCTWQWNACTRSALWSDWVQKCSFLISSTSRYSCSEGFFLLCMLLIFIFCYCLRDEIKNKLKDQY